MIDNTLTVLPETYKDMVGVTFVVLAKNLWHCDHLIRHGVRHGRQIGKSYSLIPVWTHRYAGLDTVQVYNITVVFSNHLILVRVQGTHPG